MPEIRADVFVGRACLFTYDNEVQSGAQGNLTNDELRKGLIFTQWTGYQYPTTTPNTTQSTKGNETIPKIVVFRIKHMTYGYDCVERLSKLILFNTFQ